MLISVQRVLIVSTIGFLGCKSAGPLAAQLACQLADQQCINSSFRVSQSIFACQQSSELWFWKKMELVFAVLLLSIVTGPQVCQAGVNDCRGQEGFVFPPENQTSYVTYSFDLELGTCDNLMQTCNATIPNQRLSNRVWYISPNRPGNGIGYSPNTIQLYNIQCPANHMLHLYPQYLDTEADTNGACGGFDFVTVLVDGEDFTDLCGGEEQRIQHPLYNDRLGVIVEGGNATIEFCSNGNFVNTQGFVIRAMCIDPAISCLPGCVNFNDIKAEGQDFIDRVLGPHPTPERVNILHKREAVVPLSVQHMVQMIEEGGSLDRDKRFVSTEFFNHMLTEGQTVMYEDNVLTIDYNNGSSDSFDVFWLVTTNDLIGTRVFDEKLPSKIVPAGPGKVEIFGDLAFVDYTFEDLSIFLLPSLEVANILEVLANYTYFNYIDPYPVICPLPEDDILTFPLPFASQSDPRYRPVFSLGYVQEDIQSGQCQRAVRIDRAPAFNSQIEKDVFDFCQFFFYACNPLLRIMCAEIVNLDRLSGK